MEDQARKSTIQPVLIGINIALVTVNVLFLALFASQVKSIALLKEEVGMLMTAKKAVEASSEVTKQYADTLGVFEDVFPDEETMPTFIQALETKIRAVSGEYSIKFNSLTPVPEQDKLFLLLTINMKTDYEKLNLFLDDLEKMPYMTHVTLITGKTQAGFTGEGSYSIGLKIYVKNPFTSG